MSTPGIGSKPKISLNDVRKKSASNTASLRARAGGGLSGVQRTSIFTRPLGAGRATQSYNGWVGAQRSFNPYDTQSALINRNAQMRAEANRYAGMNTGFGYATMGGGVSNDMDTLTKVMMGIQMGKALGESLFGILNATGVIDKAKASVEAKKDAGSQSLGKLASNSSSISTAKTLTGGLKGATSFSSIKDLESQASDKKANLNDSYKQTSVKDAVDETLSNENVKAGLTDAGVDIDTSALGLSDLNPDNLEESLNTIETDINNITNLQTSTLPDKKAKVKDKSEQVGLQIRSVTSQISKCDSQISTLDEQIRTAKAAGQDVTALEAQKTALEAQKTELEAQKTELEKQKEKLDAAAGAIDQVISQCGKAIDALNGKKSEINDLKQFEDSVKDKKYDLAKTQDEQLKKTMDQIEKLNKDISSLQDKDPNKADKSDQNRLAKYNQLIQQRSGLYQTLGTLTESLSSAGQTEFKNSKNNSYTLKNLDKAMNFGQPPKENVDNG